MLVCDVLVLCFIMRLFWWCVYRFIGFGGVYRMYILVDKNSLYVYYIGELMIYEKNKILKNI